MIHFTQLLSSCAFVHRHISHVNWDFFLYHVNYLQFGAIYGTTVAEQHNPYSRVSVLILQAGIIPCAFAFGATYIKNRDLSITAQSGVVVSGGRPPMKTDRPGFLISVGYGCSRPLFHKEGHSLSCNAALLFSGLHFYLDYWNSAANTIRINWNFKNLNCSFSKTEIITSLRVFWLSKKN